MNGDPVAEYAARLRGGLGTTEATVRHPAAAELVARGGGDAELLAIAEAVEAIVGAGQAR